MAWNWPIITQLFGNQFAGVQDWFGQNQMIIWIVVIIIIVLIALGLVLMLRRR